jgi:curved DNA-binding protein CbpA
VELIRAAYHKLAKQYHPDRFVLSHPGEKALADKIFARIVVAYSVLTDAEERRRYEEELASGASAGDAAEKVARVMAAEKAFTRGELAMRRRQFAEALAAFEQAVQLYDEEGEYHAFLGYALLLNHPADPRALERAQAEFDRAKRLNPKCDRAFLFNGYLHKSTGKMAKAETEFRQATELNPQNVEAARELRLMAMRREKGDGKRGAR